MNLLKQMKLICKDLGEEDLFTSIVTNYMKKTVNSICEEYPS